MTEKLEEVINSTAMTGIVRVAQVALVPILIWFANNMMDVSKRLTRVEQSITDKLDGAYPRGEAGLAFGIVNARIDANIITLRDHGHRLETLEEARNRLR